MKKLLLLLFLLSELLCSLTAQSFTFSDTYPVNNPDSLEAWLTAHPTPSVERLKNLIRLERTYRFGYQELLGQALPEIKQLADALKSPIGQAAYFYLSSVVRNEERHQAFEDNNKALDLFLNLNDTSGMIHVLSKLGADNFNLAGAEVGNQPLSENYIQKAQSLLAKRFDPHDYITTAWAVYLSIYGERPLDRQKMLKQAQQTFNQILKYSECQYYMPISKTCIAIAQYCLGNYAESYRINKEVLRIMKPRQINERVRIMLNMVNDCEFLDKDEERIKLCQEARQIMLQHNYQNWYSSEDIFLTLKEIMYKRGNYKLATEYGDSLLIAHDSLYNAQRNQKFIELQSRYQASEKQKQIAELTLKQKESESRNRFILTIFVMALLASAVLGLLWMRLRRTNAQLLDANIQLQKHTRTREQFFAIIAHDLRRPFYAFQEISNLVSYYLKKGDYNAIKNISESIDESGLKIRQLLDNLLKWALSQKEEIPYKPEDLNLLSVINEVLNFFQTVYAHYPIDFKVDCPPPLSIKADKNALDVILRNIISNSLVAIDKNKGVIEVKAELKSKKMICLTITDNGKGLDEVKAEAFRQVLANPNIGEVGQNGLGLVLIAKFTKRNGITVDFDSRVGEGTVFKLSIPT